MSLDNHNAIIQKSCPLQLLLFKVSWLHDATCRTTENVNNQLPPMIYFEVCLGLNLIDSISTRWCLQNMCRGTLENHIILSICLCWCHRSKHKPCEIAAEPNLSDSLHGWRLTKHPPHRHQVTAVFNGWWPKIISDWTANRLFVQT